MLHCRCAPSSSWLIFVQGFSMRIPKLKPISSFLRTGGPYNPCSKHSPLCENEAMQLKSFCTQIGYKNRSSRAKDTSTVRRKLRSFELCFPRFLLIIHKLQQIHNENFQVYCKKIEKNGTSHLMHIIEYENLGASFFFSLFLR